MWKITYFVCVLISFACFLFLEVEGRGGRGGGGGGRSSGGSRGSRGGAIGGSSSGGSGGGSASPATIGIVLGCVLGPIALTIGTLCLALYCCKNKRNNPSLPTTSTMPVLSGPVIARAANTSERSATQPGQFKAPSAGNKQGVHEKVWITPAPGSHTIRAGQALDDHYSNSRSNDKVMGKARSYNHSSAGTQSSKKPLPSF